MVINSQETYKAYMTGIEDCLLSNNKRETLDLVMNIEENLDVYFRYLGKAGKDVSLEDTSSN